MEIKQGDKVRVSKDAPRMYLRGWAQVFQIREAEVITIEDDNAVIETFELSLAIPTKYLIKVDAEAKESKFKKGDKVCINKSSLKHGLRGEIITIIGVEVSDKTYLVQSICMRSPIWLREDEISLYTAPTIKVGDIVIVKQDVEMSKTFSIFKREVSIVKRIDNDRATLEIKRMKHQDLELTDVPLECIEKVDAIEYLHGNGWAPTEPTEAECTKTKDDTLTFPIAFDLTDSYWDAYAADLAKEIALKVANKYDDPTEAAEYAVRVAKAVVERLKRK